MNSSRHPNLLCALYMSAMIVADTVLVPCTLMLSPKERVCVCSLSTLFMGRSTLTPPNSSFTGQQLTRTALSIPSSIFWVTHMEPVVVVVVRTVRYDDIYRVTI